MGDFRVHLWVCPNHGNLTGGSLDSSDLNWSKLGGKKVCSRLAKPVNRLQIASICSIFENEDDFHKWIQTKDLNPDQGLGINGVQDPLDGVVANVLD